jgi:hypothetical protein
VRFHLLGLAASGLIASCVLLTGCSASFAPGPETPVETPFGDISGTVYGGQQPIVNATVFALQTSTTAYGGPSTQLATSPTNSAGFFTFPAATTCTSGTVVYLYSLGGQPTTGNTNSAAGLMAVLGTCPSDGLLVNAVVQPPATSAQIYMNEVSTVAAAYALAGFAVNSSNVSTSAMAIGALTTSDTLAQTGIQNAAANAAQMYTAVATADGGGLNSGNTRAALATTPGGNGTVPQKLIDTIANILAACVNSTSSGATDCTTLFNDDRSGGGQTGIEPTDTATAAIYLAQHPYSAFVTTLYNLVGSTANPFTPALAAAPASFYVELVFTGGGLNAEATSAFPQNIAIDGSGNVWTTNTAFYSVSKFSSLGVSLAGATGYTSSTCGLAGGQGATSQPASIAINAASTQAWVGIQDAGKICVLSSSGSTSGSTLEDIPLGTADSDPDGPYGIAFDGSGNAWATVDYGTDVNETGGPADGQLYEINPSTYIATEKENNTNGFNGPWAIAIESPSSFGGNHNGDIWTANFNATNNGNATPDSVFSSTGTIAAEVTEPAEGYSGIAIDSNGKVWTGSFNSATIGVAGGVTVSSSAGSTPIAYNLNAANFVTGVAIDGGNNVWFTAPLTDNGSSSSNAIFELNNSGTNISGPNGYIPITIPIGVNGQNTPNAIAVDGSGNVWWNTLGDTTLRELIGAALPVATPLAYGAANNKLGSRP